MRLTWIIAINIGIISSCTKDNCTAIPIQNCFVTEELNPVCGCDGVTYPNPSHARCNQVDFTSGRCSYSNEALLGTWTFLGYVSDGAVFQVDKKVHTYDMYITFKNEKVILNDVGYHVLEGKSAVNFIGGGYRLTNKNQLRQNISFTTKIGVTDKDVKSENKFIDYLRVDCNFKIAGAYLEIKSTLYTQDGTATPKEEILIFRRK